MSVLGTIKLIMCLSHTIINHANQMPRYPQQMSYRESY
jgi:hypothetical protein